jgi:hypothetical protein
MKKLKNIVFECKLYIVISHKKKLHTHTHTHIYIYIYHRKVKKYFMGI